MPFGNAVGEGFVNPGIVVAKQVIVDAINNGGVYCYNSTSPAFGTLIATAGLSGAGLFDGVGNAVLAGNTVYSQLLSNLWSATQQFGPGIFCWTAPGPGGPWTQQGTIQLLAGGNLFFQFNGASGSIPQPAAGITTVANVVTALTNMGFLH